MPASWLVASRALRVVAVALRLEVVPVVATRSEWTESVDVIDVCRWFDAALRVLADRMDPEVGSAGTAPSLVIPALL